MATSQSIAGPVTGEPKSNTNAVAGAVITGHGFQHMYGHSFLVIIPEIYEAFSLTPSQVALMPLVQQASSGTASMGGGVIVDRLQGRKGLFLSLSLFTMAFGYLLVGMSTTYGLILLSLVLAQAAASFWHPVGIGMLSQMFPSRRGFFISLHRSAGSIGDTVAPLAVGALLVVMTYRGILTGAFLLMTAVAAFMLMFLWRAGFRSAPRERQTLSAQFRSLGGLFQTRGLPLLMLVAGLRGMADRSMLVFLPLYLSEQLGYGSVGQGFHIALLVGIAIVAAPFIAHLSDRRGRRPVIIGVMACSTVTALLLTVFSSGLAMTALIATLGMFMFSINNLTQAGALDLAEGRQLEGSMVGLLWGNNALFGAFSPLILGFLIEAFDFSVIFKYTAALYVIGTLVSFTLPMIENRSRSGAAA